MNKHLQPQPPSAFVSGETVSIRTIVFCIALSNKTGFAFQTKPARSSKISPWDWLFRLDHGMRSPINDTAAIHTKGFLLVRVKGITDFALKTIRVMEIRSKNVKEYNRFKALPQQPSARFAEVDSKTPKERSNFGEK